MATRHIVAHYYHRFIRQPMLRMLGVKYVVARQEQDIEDMAANIEIRLQDIEKLIRQLKKIADTNQMIANQTGCDVQAVMRHHKIHRRFGGTK